MPSDDPPAFNFGNQLGQPALGCPLATVDGPADSAHLAVFSPRERADAPAVLPAGLDDPTRLGSPFSVARINVTQKSPKTWFRGAALK